MSLSNISLYDGVIMITAVFTQNPQLGPAGLVQLPTVELQADDGEHEDGEEEQHADLEQGNHGLHDGLQDDLETWRRRGRQETNQHVGTQCRITTTGRGFTQKHNFWCKDNEGYGLVYIFLKIVLQVSCCACVLCAAVLAFCDLIRDFSGDHQGVLQPLLTGDA